MRTKIAVLAFATTLTGCVIDTPVFPTLTPVLTIPTVTPAPSTITQIQNIAVAACGYLPEAGAVAQIVGAMVGGGALIGQVEQIAQEICAATASIPATKAGKYGATRYHTVLVRNVPVKVKLVR